MAPDIKPFKVDVPNSALQTVKDKLALATFPDEVEFSDDWSYGVPLSDVKRLVEYWANGFNWRAQEAKINELPQYMTKVNVDGFGDLDIHFVHQKSSRPSSIPLLFCHGWPGSFLEVTKILPLLTDPKDGPSFHVVAPSLPNFGFSEGASKRGFGIPQYAEAMHKVMLQLGYNKYVTQGGDWGWAVTRMMGIEYPQSCLASHISMIRARAPSLTKEPIQYAKYALTPYTEEEKAGQQRTQWFMKEGFGYNLLQATKPSTIGFALADSPVALLAWVYEKLHDWTDGYRWTDDEILTWVCVYQFASAGPAASARIYYESMHAESERSAKMFDYAPGVLLGLSYFPRDIVVPPRAWGRTLGEVVFEVMHEDGGHFASYERPEVLVGDLRSMFGEGGGAYGVSKQFV